MKKAPSQSPGQTPVGVQGPHMTGSAIESLSVRDTTPTGEEAFTSDTVTSGIYVHREQIVARLHEVGLLKHPQIKAAITAVEEKEASGELNGELQKPEGFARAVFLELTGSKAAANTVVSQLVHDPDVTEYTFGDKGVIVDRHYGKGGMAEILAVYFYGDPETGSYQGVAAVKAANATDVSKTKDRFGVEMKLMAKHSNGHETGKRGYRTIFAEYYKETGVIPLVNPKSTTFEDREYYAMELLKGHSLQDVLEEILNEDGLPLDPQVAIDLLVTLLIKLKNFRGDMHRDIKPDNIFVLDDGTVRFLDCGLSLEESGENVARMTQTTDGAMGTLSYMAPEQLGGGGKGGKVFASDVYSLAASIYELVTRALPVEGEGAMDFYMAHDRGQKPSFVVNSKISNANIPDQVEAVEQEPLLLDNLNPALAGALRQMLNYKPEERLVPGTDPDLFLRDDPRYSDGRQDFHITPAEAKAQLEKWIDELLPASSFTLDDIKDGDPSIFTSAIQPEQSELNPDLQLGSVHTRHEMYGILTGPSLASLKELEKFEAEKVAAERSVFRKKVVGWTTAITAGVAVSVGGLMFALNKKKPVGPDTPVAGQLDPSTPVPTIAVTDTTPSKFEPYPGAETASHKMVLKYKTTWVNVGDDSMTFHNADEEALKNGDHGSLTALIFNKNDREGGRWTTDQQDENNKLLLGDGVSTMRSPLPVDIEQYRKEIGSTETDENPDSYINGYHIGDYVFSVVDGEASSVLHYVGVDAGSANAPQSVVFSSPAEAAKYLQDVEVSGQESLYKQLIGAQYTKAQGPSNPNMGLKNGHNQHGRATLSPEELKEVNSTMKNVLHEYFESAERPDLRVIAERK